MLRFLATKATMASFSFCHRGGFVKEFHSLREDRSGLEHTKYLAARLLRYNADAANELGPQRLIRA
jgi:hypothetical protein